MIPEKMLELIILKMLTNDSAYSWRSDIKNKMFIQLLNPVISKILILGIKKSKKFKLFFLVLNIITKIEKINAIYPNIV